MDAKANGALPAFHTVVDDDMTFATGLSKRELFAAMAMQGIVSNPELGKQMRQKTDKVVGDTVARLAFECADALLTELSKEVP